jgi:hypothetical protein
VRGSNYGHAHTSTGISTNFRIRFLPLLGKEGQNLLQQGFAFFSEKSIGGDHHEWCKMSALLKARLEILLLFLFVCYQNFVWCLERLDLASTSVMHTSIMQSVPWAQRPHSNTSPRSSPQFLRKLHTTRCS